MNEERSQAPSATDERETVRGSIESQTPATVDRDSLLPANQMDRFRDRWDDIQTGFVDNPRSAVESAQELVENVVGELTDVFESERRNLEAQWSRGDADTEGLRVALQRYRSFFQLLLGD
jgi:hypothetical protein